MVCKPYSEKWLCSYSHIIPTQQLKAQKKHGNLTLAFIFGFSKENTNSLFVKLLSVTAWTFLKLYSPNEV